MLHGGLGGASAGHKFCLSPFCTHLQRGENVRQLAIKAHVHDGADHLQQRKFGDDLALMRDCCPADCSGAQAYLRHLAIRGRRLRRRLRQATAKLQECCALLGAGEGRQALRGSPQHIARSQASRGAAGYTDQCLERRLSSVPLAARVYGAGRANPL